MKDIFNRVLSYQSVGPDGEVIPVGVRAFYNIVLPVFTVGLLVLILLLA